MKTFRLSKGGSTKEQTKQAGVLLIVLGIPMALFVSGYIGAFMVFGGLGCLLAAHGGSE